MTLLRWRFGRSAPDVPSRSTGPAGGRQVMTSASFKPCSTAGCTMRSCSTRGRGTGSQRGRDHAQGGERPHCLHDLHVHAVAEEED
jgi:hypothetical protein